MTAYHHINFVVNTLLQTLQTTLDAWRRVFLCGLWEYKYFIDVTPCFCIGYCASEGNFLAGFHSYIIYLPPGEEYLDFKL